LTECVEELSNEMQKYQAYQRLMAKQQSDEQQFQQRKKLEQQERAKLGLPALPITPEEAAAFKAPPPPSLLEGLLITAQVTNYCRQISQVT